MTDNIFARLHSSAPPGPHDTLPVLMQDNPSRDFVFPANVEDVVAQIDALPRADTEAITHLWMRRPHPGDGSPLAEFICGSRVRGIVFYAWPTELVWRLGRRKPAAAYLRALAPWTTDLRLNEDGWCLHWQPEAAGGYVLDHLVPHEVILWAGFAAIASLVALAGKDSPVSTYLPAAGAAVAVVCALELARRRIG